MSCSLFLAIVLCVLAQDLSASQKPYINGRFQGRIAYSADGNHNDPDDWAASPVALAIAAEAGLKDRLVHFDYNCILPLTDPEWEKKHAEGVLGTAGRYGFDTNLFFDCQKYLQQAIKSIAAAIDESSENNPLYFVIAGPMEVPYLGIQKSDPRKRQFVYCISHSRWNDGFASSYKFTFTKRTVIEQDVHWVQIRDQNRLLSRSPYKRPARPEEFAPFFWMRDSRDAKVRFLWERTLVSTRPDPSDAGMMYFLATGDEDCTPEKLKALIEEHHALSPITARPHVRLEAENFRHIDGFIVDDRKDRNASQQLSLKSDGAKSGVIRTRFDEPFTKVRGRYTIVVRHGGEAGSRFRFSVNGRPTDDSWQIPPAKTGWLSHTLQGIEIRTGDELRIDAEGSSARLDYIQLDSAD